MWEHSENTILGMTWSGAGRTCVPPARGRGGREISADAVVVKHAFPRRGAGGDARSAVVAGAVPPLRPSVGARPPLLPRLRAALQRQRAAICQLPCPGGQAGRFLGLFPVTVVEYQRAGTRPDTTAYNSQGEAYETTQLSALQKQVVRVMGTCDEVGLDFDSACEFCSGYNLLRPSASPLGLGVCGITLARIAERDFARCTPR